MKVAELERELGARGLPTTGRKADLLRRLSEAAQTAARDEGAPAPEATPAPTTATPALPATTSTPFPSEEEMSAMKVAELERELGARGLPTTGRKADLLRRLSEAAQTAARDEGPPAPEATPVEPGASTATIDAKTAGRGSKLRRPTARATAKTAVARTGATKALPSDPTSARSTRSRKRSARAAPSVDSPSVPLALKRLQNDEPNEAVIPVAAQPEEAASPVRRSARKRK